MVLNLLTNAIKYSPQGGAVTLQVDRVVALAPVGTPSFRVGEDPRALLDAHQHDREGGRLEHEREALSQGSVDVDRLRPLVHGHRLPGQRRLVDRQPFGADEPGIGPVVWGSDGEQFDLIRQKEDWRDVLEQEHPVMPHLVMQGNAVFRWASYEMAKIAQQALDRAGITVDDLDVFVPHQANMRIIDAMARSMKLPEHVQIARDIAELLNRKAGKNVLLTIADGSTTSEISARRQLRATMATAAQLEAGLWPDHRRGSFARRPFR